MLSKLLLGYLLLPLLVSAVIAADNSRTLTVNGEGTATSAPDMAEFTTAVVTEAQTTTEALQANNVLVKQIMEVLRANQIADKDIRTSGLTIVPKYSRPRGGDAQEIEGYQVNNQLHVVVRNLPALGTLLDAAVKAGSNQILGVSFDIDDKTAVLNEAQRRAVRDARARAELYAEACGVSIGKVIAIQEAGAAVPGPRPVNFRMMAAEAAVPIATGEQQIQTSITITYELLD